MNELIPLCVFLPVLTDQGGRLAQTPLVNSDSDQLVKDAGTGVVLLSEAVEDINNNLHSMFHILYKFYTQYSLTTIVIVDVIELTVMVIIITIITIHII